MIDLAGLSLVPQRGREFFYQSIVPIRGFQQHSPAVGTALSLIKLGYDRLAKNPWEQQTLCCAIVRHEEASARASKLRLVNVFVAQEASFVFKFVNYSG
jgi:hypothetical protein